MSKKTYISHCRWERRSEILYEETRGKAKARAANFFGDDFIHVRVERVPELDKYEGEITPKILIEEQDWSYDCWECSRRLYQEDVARYTDGDHPVCLSCAGESEGDTNGLAALVGQWPGDETDEEIREALEDLS